VEEILEEMAKRNTEVKAATCFREEFEAWKAWCSLFDKKEELEQSSRDEAKEYEL